MLIWLKKTKPKKQDKNLKETFICNKQKRQQTIIYQRHSFVNINESGQTIESLCTEENIIQHPRLKSSFHKAQCPLLFHSSISKSKTQNEKGTFSKSHIKQEKDKDAISSKYFFTHSKWMQAALTLLKPEYRRESIESTNKS